MQEAFVEPVAQQSQLMWLYSALGFKYATAIPLTGLFSLVVTLLLVIRGRGPSLGGALFFVVAAPVFVGALGTLEGATFLYQVIAISQTAPTAGELAEGFSAALVTMQVGLLLASPSFAIATVGLIIRALTDRSPLAGYSDPDGRFAPPDTK
jgi:hypothetical protein